MVWFEVTTGLPVQSSVRISKLQSEKLTQVGGKEEQTVERFPAQRECSHEDSRDLQ